MSKRRLISHDYESHLINTDYPEPIGYQGLAPLPVCLSYQELGQDPQIVVGDDMQIVQEWFADDNVTLLGQNIAFENLISATHLGVPMEQVFRKYHKGLIRETQVRETLLHLANGDAVRHPNWYNDLGSLVKRHLDIDISATKGEDAWRMRYSELYGVPLEEWPQEAIDYSIMDSVYTLKVFAKQHAQRRLFQANELKQTRAAWDLHLISARSPRVNDANIEAFVTEHQAEVDKAQAPLIAKGVLKANPHRHKEFPKGDPRRAGFSMDTKLLKRIIQADYTRQGKVVPGTPSGDISTAGETLLGCTTPALRRYGEAAFNIKMVDSYVPALRKAQASPLKTVSPRYGVIKKTGRTGCTQPNMQNVTRTKGARECFEAPEGKIFAAIDFASMEMFCLAQTMWVSYQSRKMLDELNTGKCPHVKIAANTMGIPFEEAEQAYAEYDKLGDEASEQAKLVAAYRQFGKIQNFGFAGGMGAGTTLSNMNDKQIDLLQGLYPGQHLEGVIKRSIQAWKVYWDLMPMFNSAAQKTQEGRKPTYVCPTTGRRKALNTYCQFCNMHFQPIAADALKEALAIIQESSWIPGRLLQTMGVELQIEIHDETIIAGPPDTVEKWAPLVGKMMVEGARKVLPDCNIRTDIQITGQFWSKSGMSLEDYLDRRDA